MWDLRMVLLMMVAICLNATLLLEQPYSSFFEFYPRFRELVAMLQKQGGPTAAPWPILLQGHLADNLLIVLKL